MPGGNEVGAHDRDAVAIVGMACVLPGAPDLEAFWSNIVDGVDSVTEVPETRWRHDLHYAPDHRGDEPLSVSKWGGFVPDIGFDALAWGIPPASLASIDPAQLLALHCAGGALDDAGYGSDGGRSFDRERASVVYATGSGGAADGAAGVQLRTWLRNHGIDGAALPPELDAFLPRLTEDGLPGALTSVIAGRVANRLDLGGKNLTVDSACASALVALDIARSELLARSSDLVLCGGVDLHNGVQDYVSFSAAQALSPTGRCRSFDTGADGMTLAEGAGCLVLKRLSDATADDDRIYAVVRGVAGSSDGRHLGLTAPRQEGQVRALRRAYAAADLHPSVVGLVEAHGTGTPTGDRIELRSTTQVYAEAGVAPGSVVLGSVKSNIGHTKCASAMASLIKTAKALHHGVLPPTLHVDEPNDEWGPSSPFVFRDRVAPWPAGGPDGRRYAGVSSFGFGGTNFHAVLADAGDGARPGAAALSGRPHWPAELFVFRAAGDAELAAQLAALAGRLAEECAAPRPADRWRLRDIAAAVGADAATDGPVRVAIVACDLDDLVSKVAAAREGRDTPGVFRSAKPVSTPIASPLASPAGTADLLVAFPALQASLAVDDACTLATALFPPQPFDDATRARQQTALADAEEDVTRLTTDVAASALALFGVTPGATTALTDTPPTAVAVDRPGTHGLVALLDTLAQLAVAGVPVDLAALHRGRDSNPDRWRNPAPRPRWLVNGHCARDADGRPLPKGLHPADEAPTIRIAPATDPTPTPTPTPEHVVPPPPLRAPAPGPELAPVLAYLALVQQTIAASSEIISHELRNADQ